MTIKELKEKIKNLPDDARVELGVDVKINAQSSSLVRSIDAVEHFDKNNVVTLKSWWGVQFFY
jgi:hypothetical protein